MRPDGHERHPSSFLLQFSPGSKSMPTMTGHQTGQKGPGRPSSRHFAGGPGALLRFAGLFASLRNLGRAAVCLLLVCVVSACASDKAGMSSPELPAKYWLDDSPGIPIENQAEYEAAIPNLYNPEKKFGFEDCVYLTIQQSPVLVNSAVDIEIKRLAHTSSMWQYLPEPHMTVTVSQNLTNFNKGSSNVDSSYGTTQYEIGFYAPFPNPVASYFNSKAQAMMTGIAISTHRKAVAEAIYKIAKSYLKLQAQHNVLQARRSLVPVAKELTDYWKQVEAVEGNQGSSLSLSMQHEREAELALEKAENEETIQRTNLKVLAGLDAHQRFQVDTSQAHEILKSFNGHDLRWEDYWVDTEDNLLLRSQIKLADYQIMLSWAQYVPNMSFSVNSSPPRGQSQPSGGVTDQFLHFTFDFPLIDWGRRYRDVQTSRMGKAQAFHAMAEKRFDYQNRWILAEQNAALAHTNLKLAQNRYTTAQMQYDESRISFENGLEALPDVARYQEAMVEAQIKYIETELEYRLALLDWMYLSGLLQRRFLGLPDRELNELVGNSLNSAVPGALPPDPDDEDVFPQDGSRRPAIEDTRPIGRAVPVRFGTALDEDEAAPAEGSAREGAAPVGGEPAAGDQAGGPASEPPLTPGPAPAGDESADLSTTPTLSQ